ncbi:MAG: GNAT family N-acetyltransferase [Bacteroidota bacterium]|nr:GNAT family N-acetyltransferase [Bacteroidota bacterium]MDP4230207.1 GNAT family N-acetyltransferase [Bacteroidota bacterium]
MSNLSGLPEQIVLRPATPEDESFLLFAYETSRDEELQYLAWGSEKERESFFRMQFDAQNIHFKNSYELLDYDIIQKNNIPIGRLVLSWEPEHLHCVDIILLPEFRRNHLGAAIMEAIVSEADRRKITASLFYEKWKPYLGKFYERYGFKTIKEHQGHYYMERSAGGSQPNIAS